MFLSRIDKEDNNNLDNNILNSYIVVNPNEIKNTTKMEQEGNQLFII
ncbi:MAG TPA: hypothetical protein VF222_04755 [Nitrososphaeraceae archaeon]